MPNLPPNFRAGFALPQVFPSGQIDVAEIRSVARAAEAAGFADLWTQEQLIGTAQSLEPLTLLSYVAAVTERIRLGVSVLVLPVHSPLHLAKRLASLDVLSEGRLIAGVGLGGKWDEGALGIPEGRRLGRFMNVLNAVDALWRDPRATVAGDFFNLDGTPMEPKPLQTPRPPIWFGARVEAAVRRAARHGDGWMGPGSSSIETFEGLVPLLRDELERAGKDPATFPMSKRVYLAIDSDEERALTRLREWFAHNYGDASMAERVAVWGSHERVTAYLDRLIEAGASHLLLNPVFDSHEHLEALRPYANVAVPVGLDAVR
ncbi:MAG: LLM class flavin-dependent oxidoreductase [Chloroflexi bacterium]|nr:LLM class flavin-dependent oxidoreductase [Chloroflexota bacterium]